MRGTCVVQGVLLGLAVAAGGCSSRSGTLAPVSQTPEQRVEEAVTAMAGLARAEPEPPTSTPDDAPAVNGDLMKSGPVHAGLVRGGLVDEGFAQETPASSPGPAVAGQAAEGSPEAEPGVRPAPMLEPAAPEPSPAAAPALTPAAAPAPAEPLFDQAAARASELARQQLRRSGWALLSPATPPDDAAAAALLSSPELWSVLEGAGVSVTDFSRRWSASRQPGPPERRVAQLAELSAEGRGEPAQAGARAGAIHALGAEVRQRVVRWQAAQRSAELQAMLVRTFQAAGSLPPMGSSVEQAGERAAAQRARLELARLNTEIEAERRALARLMGLPERNDQWSPAPGPPDLPVRLGPVRSEIGVEEAVSRALRDRADIAEVRRRVQASDPRAPGRAGHEARELRRRLADLEAAARAQVREAHGRMSGARLVAEAARDALLPMHERIVDLSLERFNAGLVDAAELIAAQRELVAARRQQTDALRDYWIATIDLERAMGW